MKYIIAYSTYIERPLKIHNDIEIKLSRKYENNVLVLLMIE